MTDDLESIASDADLAETLRTVLKQAHQAGIEVEGGWECRNGDVYPDWDIVITEVEKTNRTPS